MKTEDIEYNGKVFTLRKIIDISAMIELLGALAKNQKYIEKKLNFQEERIDDKDKRISDLELKILGFSQSKEEKFPSEKEMTKIKKKEREEKEEKEEKDEKEDNLNDSELNAYLDKDDKEGEKEEKEDNKSLDKNEEEDNEEKEKESKEKEEKKENEEKNEDEENKDKKDEEDKDKEEEDKEKEKEDEEINKELDFNENITEKTKKKEDNNENENIKESSSKDKSGGNNDDLLRKLFKRIKALETKINYLEKLESETKTKTTVINNKITKNTNATDGKVTQLNKKIDELNKELKKMKDEMGKMKEKVEDFNIYDMFKGEGTGDGNVDICKGLVMALENKVFKKFGFYDIKFKKNDGDIFQNANDIKDLKAQIDSLKDREKRTLEEFDEMKNNNEEKFVDITKQIKELNEKIDETNEKINKNYKIHSDENKELNDKIKELEQKMQQKNDDIDISKYAKVQQMNPEDLKLLKELSTRINEVEKILKITFGKFSPKEVQDRLDRLDQEIVKKANKFEINEINDKLLFFEENEKDLSFKMDTIQQYNEKIKENMQNIIKKIEYLSGELNRMARDNSDDDKGKGPIIDITKLVDLNFFNDHKKEINKKFDKIRLSFEEIARNLDDILEKLSHTPSDTDFAQFQSIIKNMVEELKLSMNKKFADKSETNKSIKFLETQIKSIQESFTKKMEGADNWLLAKKPLNNYVCASCESIIRGELDKRSEYIPWNKYPNRDEKSYRMGHGFSRMLQMINEDKKKMQEIKEKEILSDEDKSRSDSEQNFVVNGSVKLPKLKHKHLNSGKLKNEHIYDEDNNLPFDTNNPYIDIDPISSVDRPKIMKIYKRTKQSVQSSYLNRNRNNDNLPSLIIKTAPNEKETQANQGIKSDTIPNEQ